MATKYVKDRFRSRRGGTSKWVLVSCLNCQSELFMYQKVGVGQLLRMYLDRIVLADGSRPYKNLEIEQIKPLECVKCGATIGSPMVYGKHGEKRVAERIVNSGVKLKKVPEHEINKYNIDPSQTIKL